MGFISLPVVFGTAVLVAETELPKLNTGLLGTTAAASFLFSATYILSFFQVRQNFGKYISHFYAIFPFSFFVHGSYTRW